tara:strand:- start:7382 stop:7930 length:549 start_codon:yes stop_codon:yes gene_type:complete
MKHIFTLFEATTEFKKCQFPNEVEVDINLFKWSKNTTVSYLAAAPPDRLQSFTGSALPFKDAEMAFENTPNKETFRPISNQLKFVLKFPNAYYSHLGTRLIPPYVRITVEDSETEDKETQYISLGEIPYRHLSWQSEPVPRIGPQFYDRKHLNARSQEDILKSSEYKMKYPMNFWGGAIPHP